MTTYDAQLSAEFKRIADGLEGERIGLTNWSGVAVTVFPLTDDYEFVVEQLDEAEQKLANYAYNFVAGTYIGDEPASLVRAGPVSCVDSFDRPDEERGRAIRAARRSAGEERGSPSRT